MANTAILILASGQYYEGKYFGYTPPTLREFSALVGDGKAIGRTCDYFAGELVFNTAMSGYVEVLSDPSFSGQLLCMTYPHIGNYGVDVAWAESYTSGLSGSQLANQVAGNLVNLTHGIQATKSTNNTDSASKTKRIMASGLIVRNLYEGPVPERRIGLSQWMQAESIVGISEIDTRALTLYIRDYGAQNAAILLVDENIIHEEIAQAVTLISKLPSMEGRNLVSQVGVASTLHKQRWDEVEVLGNMPLLDHGLSVSTGDDKMALRKPQHVLKVGILDYGCKQNIIRLFDHRNCELSVIAQHSSTREILSSNYDLVLVSNGPGDPAVLGEQITRIKELLGKTLLCGICLGTQLLALSIGANTYKMIFGHHGINHPVRDEHTKRLYITSQNHGFAVDEASLPFEAEVWFRNTNDNSLEGFRYPKKKLYSVQFHPEAAPGPTDTLWIIDYFLEMAREHAEA